MSAPPGPSHSLEGFTPLESVPSAFAPLPSPSVETLGNQRRKRKRNKPTLNCVQCVQRKHKCDRARPACSSCVRRQCACIYESFPSYSESPNDIDPRRSQSGHGSDYTIASITSSASTEDSNVLPGFRSMEQQGPGPVDNQIPPLQSILGPETRHLPRGAPSFQSFEQAEINLPRHKLTFSPQPGPFNLLGIGSRHPFHNYWTGSGGLPEVIGVLPNKREADILMDKYFQEIDPLYPIISYPDFKTEYERFWSLPMDEKFTYDAAQLALHFIVYALGTQFIDGATSDERIRAAEFYLSASHQSLCIFSYLNSFSLPTVQTMVLISYFLVNNNHVSDAWTFSGITHRQAYGLGLHRNPDDIRPELSFAEKQLRCRLWQATMFQDTSLSVYLGLPPTTQSYDVGPSYLRAEDDLKDLESPEQPSQQRSTISQLASRPSTVTDVAYIRAMWDYASFVQSHICPAESSKRPISRDATHKLQLISQFRAMYSSWQEPFNSWDPNRFNVSSSRLLRQMIAVSSNCFYVLTRLYMDRNESQGVGIDVYGALDASHEAMSAFFVLARISIGKIDLWGAYHTRAFAQAMMIGTVLTVCKTSPDFEGRDTRLMLAKSDFDRYIDCLMRVSGTTQYEAVQRDRMAELQALRDKITVA